MSLSVLGKRVDRSHSTALINQNRPPTVVAKTGESQTARESEKFISKTRMERLKRLEIVAQEAAEERKEIKDRLEKETNSPSFSVDTRNTERRKRMRDLASTFRHIMEASNIIKDLETWKPSPEDCVASFYRAHSARKLLLRFANLMAKISDSSSMKKTLMEEYLKMLDEKFVHDDRNKGCKGITYPANPRYQKKGRAGWIAAQSWFKDVGQMSHLKVPDWKERAVRRRKVLSHHRV